MIEEPSTALYADENILYFDKDTANVVFIYNEMGILDIDFNSINLDNDFDEDNPDSIVHVRLLAWHIKFDKRKGLKKELISVAWHANR